MFKMPDFLRKDDDARNLVVIASVLLLFSIALGTASNTHQNEVATKSINTY